MIFNLIKEARDNGLTSIRNSFPYQGMESVTVKFGSPLYWAAKQSLLTVIVLPLGFGEYEIIWNPDDYPG